MKTPRLFLHNPDILEKDELIAGFVARRAVLGRLIDELRKPTPSHRLIVGPRGMGKSTLLQRLRHAVDDDPDLSKKWLPLVFREEQYNVARSSDLWLNALEAVANRLSEQGAESEADAIDERSDRLRLLPEPQRAREALAALLAHGKKTKRRILLLIDNLDLLLHRLSDDEQWALRETLSGEQLLLVGASVTPHPATFEYEKPFYDFFRIESLKGLTAPEATDVLLRLSVVRNTPAVREMLATQPGRIETLRQLTGGNPRAIVMVHQVLANAKERDVVDDMTALLDLSTPLYKARFEDLAPQSQLVVDALALAWDPQTTAMLSERLSLDSKVIAAQLSRLVDQEVVEKVPYPGRKTAFQISERLFNVWYLMRAGRRARRKLLWLVRFLESFYGSDRLAERADALAALGFDAKDGELLLAMSSRIDETRRYALEVRAIELMARDSGFDERVHINLDLEGEDAHLATVADRVKRLNAIREQLAPLAAHPSGKPLAEVVCGMPASLTIREGLTAQLVASLGTSPDLRGYPVPPDASVNEAHARHIASGALSDGFDIENARRLRNAAPLAYAGVLRCCLVGARMEVVPADSWRSLIDDVGATEDVETWRLFLELADASSSLDLVEHLLSRVSTTERTPQFWSALLVSVLLIRPAVWVAKRVTDSHPEGSAQRGIAELILAPERDGGGGDFGNDSSIMYGEELEQNGVHVWRWALIARGAVAVGDVTKLRQWLDQLTWGPELRPLREAVVAAIEGEEHLLTVAPEVRPAAQSLFRWITFRREPVQPSTTTAKALQLSRLECLVLSRVDGVASVGDIADLTNQSAADCRTVLDRLFELHAIEWTDGLASLPRAASHAAPPDDLEISPERRRRIDDLWIALDLLNHYELLGISRKASRQEIRGAYFELSKAFHPDTAFRKKVGTYRSKMEAIFKRLTEAYEVLGKQKPRAEYDTYLVSIGEAKDAEEAPSKGTKISSEIVTPVPPRVISEDSRRRAAERLQRRLEGARPEGRPRAVSAEAPRTREEMARELKSAIHSSAAVSGSTSNGPGGDAIVPQQLTDAHRAEAVTWAKVLEGRPDDLTALVRVSECLLEANADLRKALGVAEGAVYLYPEHGAARRTLGRVYLAAGRPLDARRELQAALALDPTDAQAQVLLHQANSMPPAR